MVDDLQGSDSTSTGKQEKHGKCAPLSPVREKSENLISPSAKAIAAPPSLPQRMKLGGDK